MTNEENFLNNFQKQIDKVKINKANLLHIAETGIINGSLLQSLKELLSESRSEVERLQAENKRIILNSEKLVERLITFFTENLPGKMRFTNAYELREQLKSYLDKSLTE